jgi:hypothetical protein
MKLQLSRDPKIVGCIGSAAQFRRCAQQSPRDCDVLEVRLDLTGLCGGRWIEWCAQIQARKIPVLLTIRDESQGGQWQGREAERLALYLTGLKAVAGGGCRDRGSRARDADCRRARARSAGDRLLP